MGHIAGLAKDSDASSRDIFDTLFTRITAHVTSHGSGKTHPNARSPEQHKQFILLPVQNSI